jgi:type I restriction enzyme S subunit
MPNGQDIGFVSYLVQTDNYRQRLESLVESATRSHQRVLPSDVLKFRWAFPPLFEQTAIAEFLDRETGKVDELVAEQRRLMALLKEKRQAVISHAVTRGLNPAAPLKPSGIEWLGDVPAHWETPPLYVRYEQALGKMLDQGKMTGAHQTPYLRNQDVRWDRFNVDDLPTMDIRPEERERFTVRRGDILMVEGRELGRCAIWDRDDDVIGFQKALHRLRPRDRTEVTRFFYYTMVFVNSTGAFIANHDPNEIPHLTGEELRRYRFPRPPGEEQRQIVAFLDAETAKFDTLTAEAQRAIDLLQERRTALISAAVTGQIDVRAVRDESGGRIATTRPPATLPALP